MNNIKWYLYSQSQTLQQWISWDNSGNITAMKFINLSDGTTVIDGSSVSSPIPGNQFTPFNDIGIPLDSIKECSHDMIEYIGFTERYNHCRHCGIKE